jgi:amino acid adenylation domain-containing protein
VTPSPVTPVSGLLPSAPTAGSQLERASGTAPLSWEQEQIWLHGKLFPGSPLYTETIVIHYRGELNVAALERSLHALRQRHAIWRTTIEEDDGTPRQLAGAASPIEIDRLDLAGYSETERDRHVDRLLTEARRQPFNLVRGPLLRVSTARYGPNETRIFLTLHHLIFDGASLRQIVLPQLVELYTAFCAGGVPPSPPPPPQYLEYARLQREHAPREAALAFWRAKLLDLAPLNLPVDRPRLAQTGRPGAVHTFRFDEALSGAIRDMTRGERTTAFSVLLASIIVLLARSSDTQDVTIGTSYGGRASTELEDVLGCFLNTLLLRTDLTGDPSFRDLLSRVREVTLDALEHADAPFQEVVRESLPRTSLGDSPVQAVFAFQPPSAELPPEWDLDVFGVFNGCAKFDLHLEVEQATDGLRGRLMYSTDLFEAETIESLYRHWTNLIHAAVRAPETCIWKLPMLDDSERDWLLDGVNASAAEFPQLCVHDLFTQRAAGVPERPAISFQGNTLSYRQLEQSSAQIAAHLHERGLGAGSVIGLMLERSPEMVAGLLGILRAGAAYVPLDPTYPAARLEHMLRASGAALILTESTLIPSLQPASPPLLTVAECLAGSARGSPVKAKPPQVSLDASAYILFTSGSTGLPKGVEISHRALTNLLWSMRDRPGIQEHDVLLAVTSISFDISGLELYLPLIAGARVELASVAEAADPKLLAQRVQQSGATMLQATPATWRMLIESGWKPPRPMQLLCGGEALTGPLARQLLERSHSVWNLYGPTETTIWSACARVEASPSDIVLGEPVANTSLFVLDAHRSLVPAGVAGELYIGGAGLAKGYFGQPELTRERFPSISLGQEKVRLYRTGDRVKRLRDGSLVFLGRSDRQIKLHGFRIELGEIEQALNSLPGVQQSIVVQRHPGSPAAMLAGFVVPQPGFSLRLDELRSGLAIILPRHLQPATLHILSDVPLTLNGKLDRGRLADLSVDEEPAAAEEPLPGTEATLAALWCSLLGLKAVGRRENFFDLGGHSLLAVRFVSSAASAFARDLTLASFIQAPTVAQFARVVEGGRVPHTLLLKRGSPHGQQLLWIGMEPWLTRFARHLREDMTLYTITPDLEPGLEAGQEAGQEAGPEAGLGGSLAPTIEVLAAQVLTHVRELQPEGPYLLGGFCLRSLLAYEVAQRLRREGQEVVLLVLGDLYAPGRRPQWTRLQRIIRRIHRESCNLSAIFRLPGTERASAMRQLGAFWVRLLRNGAADAEVSGELLDALYAAELRYQPAPYSGNVLFLESGESRLLAGTTSGSWQHFLEQAEVYRYPGIHETVLSDPHLRLAAEKIQSSIACALGAELSTTQRPGCVSVGTTPLGTT